MSSIAVDITSHAPSGYRDLMWDVFFASRMRGVSITAHFPWFDTGKCFFAIVRAGDQVVGGLSVKPVKRGPAGQFASIVGLVCVASAHRGRGYSTLALRSAIDHSADLGSSDVVLWTGKPEVYEKLGFQLDDSAAFGTVRMPTYLGEFKATATRSIWPDAGDTRGLPPFAEKAYRWSTPSASAVIVHDSAGPILAEWHGADESVIQLLSQTMPSEWRINTLVHDTLPESLQRAGATVALRPLNLQMILNQRTKTGEPYPYRLRLLDRI
jgi:GNAT superfamily N-acetyltransferase